MNLHELTVDQWLSWERDGFLVIDNFLSEEEIRNCNKALDRSFETFKNEGRSNSAYAQMNNVEQVSGIIEYDDQFLELMEHPRMMRIIRDVLGDKFVMVDNDGLIKKPKQVSHTSWHRDTTHYLMDGGKRFPFMVKAFYFLADVPFDGGCLSFLPGSKYLSDDVLPKVEKPEDMPGHVRMNVKAGTAVLFDGYTYHSALNNTSDEHRRSIIYNYGHMFLRTWPSYEPSLKLQEKAVTPLRKMLFGMLPWVKDPKAFNEEAQNAGSTNT